MNQGRATISIGINQFRLFISRVFTIYKYHIIAANPYLDSLHEVVFAEKEHAQIAINILGDELKYLFEPW